MIISHKHKYLFVELPLTGTTAISKELRENYDGIAHLTKHATYQNFLEKASEEEKKYFVFSCLRNPMDQVVSYYFKYKTDHKNRFSDEAKLNRYKGLVKYSDTKKFRYIHDNNATFADFFLKFYKIPYNNWSQLSHKEFDFIIRFESLQDDFSQALNLIGIEQKRPLPSVNKTAEKGDFLAHYTPETIAHAKRVFGPFMKKWGYDFPPEWGPVTVSRWNQIEFDFYNIFRGIFWRYLRNRI